jgi:hypothetical protein
MLHSAAAYATVDDDVATAITAIVCSTSNQAEEVRVVRVPLLQEIRKFPRSRSKGWDGNRKMA